MQYMLTIQHWCLYFLLIFVLFRLFPYLKFLLNVQYRNIISEISGLTNRSTRVLSRLM